MTAATVRSDRTAVRRVAAVGLVLVAMLAGTVGPAAATPVSGSADGLQLIADEQLSDDGRLRQLTLHSTALGRDARVRLLLPAGYDATGTERFPMLLLLHGAGGNHAQWTDRSDIEGLTAPLDLIVVMPEGEPNGFYSDWLDGPQLETFHLGELVPWIDEHYRTVGTRAGRAIAGQSMGGFGSMVYAARHPDLWVAAAELSGAVDVADLTIAEAAVLEALGYGDDRRWGPYLTHEATWRGHNPPDLAGNLRWTDLFLRTGTGVLCPGDEADDVFLEAGVFVMHQGFTPRLSLAGVPYDYVFRPCGTHSFLYWQADMAEWLPRLMDTFGSPPPAPTVFDYRTTDAAWSLYDWSFAVDRPAVEFVDLTSVSPDGLTARGSGPLAVTTPPSYESGATYRLTTNQAGAVTVPVGVAPDLELTVPSGAPPGATDVRAGDDGRLRFTIDLGPAHTANQYSPEGIAAEALAAATYFRQVTVAIERVTGPPAPIVAPASEQTLPATGGDQSLTAVALLMVGALAGRALVRRTRA